MVFLITNLGFSLLLLLLVSIICDFLNILVYARLNVFDNGDLLDRDEVLNFLLLLPSLLLLVGDLVVIEEET